MSFLFQEKASKSPFVQTIWHTHDVSNGVYMAEADGCWDIIFTFSGLKTKILLSGPTSEPTLTSYKAGNENIGIQFKPSTIFTFVAARDMHNKVRIIFADKNNTFRLFGQSFSVPTIHTIDAFICQLELHGLLARDAVVDSVLRGEQPKVTKRSTQRHFARTTTVAPGYYRRIVQARLAVGLLRQNTMPIASVASEAGYADQAHMTRALKKLVGLTPTEIIASDALIKL